MVLCKQIVVSNVIKVMQIVIHDHVIVNVHGRIVVIILHNTKTEFDMLHDLMNRNDLVNSVMNVIVKMGQTVLPMHNVVLLVIDNVLSVQNLAYDVIVYAKLIHLLLSEPVI